MSVIIGLMIFALGFFAGGCVVVLVFQAYRIGSQSLTARKPAPFTTASPTEE